MLSQLSIKNYALIDNLEMAPSAKLNIITGETGAGKSIMLGALGLLLGNRADTRVLLDEKSKCVVEGSFNVAQYNLQAIFEEEDLDYEKNTVLRREISPAGKSRAFVNDTPVTLDVMKKLGSRLMDIHSQHDHLNLENHQFQLKILDAYAGNSELKAGYQKEFQNWKTAQNALEELLNEGEGLKKEADFNKFQLEELDRAGLDQVDQEAMEAELEVLENAEEIKIKLGEAIHLLDTGEVTTNDLIKQAKASIDQISRMASKYRALAERINSALIEMQDISVELQRENDSVDIDQHQLEALQAQLSGLFHLQKKHQTESVKDLILLQDGLRHKVEKAGNLDQEIARAQSRVKEAEDKLKAVALVLSESRKKVAEPLAGEIMGHITALGMPNAKIKIEMDHKVFGQDGQDEIRILFSANKGIAPTEIKNAASGGEFSRLMFAIKAIMATKTAMPTIILDEIDTGVSGEIAIKLGEMMKIMANNHQVITISHLPQIAAKGDSHYYVYKDESSEKSISRIKNLSEAERVDVLAKMIGGDQPTPAALSSARELMGQ